MATLLQLEANRKNAKLSTGPKTREGKRVASSNAIRHGLRSTAALIAGESVEDWSAHEEGVQDSFAPVTYLGSCLARLAAVDLWRLDRVHAFEAAIIRDQQELPPALAAALADVQGRLDEAQAVLVLLDSVEKLEDDESVDADTAAAALDQAMKSAGVGDRRAFGQSAGVLNIRIETVGDLKSAASRIEKAATVPSGTALARAREGAEWTRRLCLIEFEAAADAARRYRALWAIPSEAQCERLCRYEAAIRRSLSRSLADLHKLMEMRGSEPGSARACR
jgi:hypothetical protein